MVPRRVGHNAPLVDLEILRQPRSKWPNSQTFTIFVLFTGHTPFDLSVDPNCLLWNYKEVLNLLHSFDCVVAVITGHTHHFSYRLDELGVHFVTMPGIVEIQPGSNGFGTIEVYKEKLILHIHGVRDVKSLEMVSPKTIQMSLH